ncbi:cysteine desulfurase [Nitrospira defluvii]|nr:cysteine desulfurase [Nitrospira defluvii]
MIYLDYIAATPLLAEAREAMLPYLGGTFGNPQSRHRYGEAPREAIETARKQVAQLIACDTCEIIFTASGSEASNLAIQGIVRAYPKKGRHIVTTSIEHYSVAHPLKQLEKEGYEITWLAVDREGNVHAEQIANAIRDDTILVSILHANNEIGTIQSLEEIGRMTEAADVFFHSDAVATAGVIPFDCDVLGIDLASFSAQQFYGPKGVGALYLRRGTRLSPLIEGGIQERGRRAGTENVAGIIGMGIAAVEAKKGMTSEIQRLTVLRDHLIDSLLKTVPLLQMTGSRLNRLPHIASFAVEYLDGEALIRSLEKRGILAASGSSCSADALKISPVLTAIGLPGNVAQGGIVFSLGSGTTHAEIEHLLNVFPESVEVLRRVSPLYADLVQKKTG